METVEFVDLDRFMGEWYVIALIPNFIERSAVNGIESYKRISENEISINYTFSQNELGKDVKRLTAKAYIFNPETNAEWRVRFFWPVKFPYLVINLAEDYSYTVIGVPNRKYVWIMARKARMEESTYQEILAGLKVIGYDISRIVKMPQNWG
ncbi:MAG: lipocalin family protein [Candidatus Cloacimonetes bacterium]|nr:lipocalin family protein [Candidatus Cloacimonadota bacterium]